MSDDDPASNLTFHAPPGWPAPPRGWAPPPGWAPDPSWPPAPPDWVFWRPAEPTPDQPPPPPVAEAHVESTAMASAAATAESDETPDPDLPAPGAAKPRRGKGLTPARVALLVAAAVVVVGLVTIGLIVTFGNPCRNPRPGADLTACDLTGQDLSGKDLTGATLTGAVLRSAGLSGAVLSGADLTDADLTGADLSNANLESATLTDATLAEADLGHAVLTDATLGGADLTRANLVGATLSGASLNAATLENADVSESEMVGTDLTEANLSEADLSGSAMAGASLARSRLDGADLTGADLENADLSSSTLTGAVLHRSNLTETVGLTDEMLADALGVSVMDLAAEVYRLQLHFNDTTAVIAAVAPAVAGTGVQGAHPYADSPAFHPLVVVGAGGETLTPDWAAGVQGLWMPEALRFVELVAVTEPGREVVEDCGMYVNSVTYAETGHLIRYRETIGVRVYAAATGQLVAAQVFRGPDPRACNPENEATSTILNGLWGEPADYAAVVPWLAGIIHAPTDAAGT